MQNRIYPFRQKLPQADNYAEIVIEIDRAGNVTTRREGSHSAALDKTLDEALAAMSKQISLLIR